MSNCRRVFRITLPMFASIAFAAWIGLWILVFLGCQPESSLLLALVWPLVYLVFGAGYWSAYRNAIREQGALPVQLRIIGFAWMGFLYSLVSIMMLGGVLALMWMWASGSL